MSAETMVAAVVIWLDESSDLHAEKFANEPEARAWLEEAYAKAVLVSLREPWGQGLLVEDRT